MGIYLPGGGEYADTVDISPEALMRRLRAWGRRAVAEAGAPAGVTACALFGYAEALVEREPGRLEREVVAGPDERDLCHALMVTHRESVPLAAAEHRHFCLACVNCEGRGHHVPLDLWPSRAQLLVLAARCNGMVFAGEGAR